MQLAGFVVDHAAAHRDGVPQDFIGDAELFERVNSARGKREVDRASADDVALARIGASFVKIDLVSAPPQVCREQSAGKAAADENEFGSHFGEWLTADQAEITDFPSRISCVFSSQREDLVPECRIAA